MEPITQVEYDVENNLVKTTITSTVTTVNETKVTLDFLIDQLALINKTQTENTILWEKQKAEYEARIAECRKNGLKTQAELTSEVVPMEN